ncbi:MAG: FkbM family methyltransferase [Phycisphaerae bacterium]|nr:FkbM family methyltransferase [Phycisphaerae bacterium]
MQRLVRSVLRRAVDRSPRVRAMLAGMLGHQLRSIDLDFLAALPAGLVVDLDHQFELERREPGMPSILWSILWEASAARRYGKPYPTRVEYRLRGKRFTMELDLAESPECGYLLRNPTIRLTAQLLTGGATMLDIGANAGFHALTAALFFRRVVAFEPTPATAARLERNVALSQFAHVDVQRVALSDRDGEATFQVNPIHCGANRLADSERAPTSAVRVELRRLDALMPTLGTVDMIKIDVEGHECEVLAGGLALIARDRPTLVVEFNTPPQFERFRAMLPPGYRALKVDLDGGTTALADASAAVTARDVTFRGR